jgi:hypothetical protein
MRKKDLKELVETNLERTSKDLEKQEWKTLDEIKEQVQSLGFQVRNKKQMQQLIGKLLTQGVLVSKKREDGERVYASLV